MRVKAFVAYKAHKDDELSLAVDDLIDVEDKSSKEMLKGTLISSGECGLFPRHCVHNVNDSSLLNNLNINFNSNSVSSSSYLPSSSNHTNFDKSKKLHDLPGKMDDKRISIGKHGIGDMFSSSIKKIESALTEKGGKQKGPVRGGPSSQIIRVQPQESLNSNGAGADIAPKLPPKPVREQAQVLYSYEAQNEDELTIKEGETITIISKENEDAGWWKGELNGRIALFPDNFVKIIKPAVLPPLPPVDSDKVRIKKPDRANDSTVSPTSSSSITGSSVPVANSHIVSKKSKYPSLTTTTTTTITNNNNSSTNNSNPSQSNNPSAQSQSISASNGSSNSSKLSDSGDNLSNDEPKSPSLKDEQNNLFSTELHSPSKLVHLTALRPKIPVHSRRPPSLYISKEFDDSLENGNDDIPELDSPQNETTTTTTTESVPSPSSTSVHLRSTNKTESTTTTTTTTQSTTNSSPVKAPWVMELKKAQERRKGGNDNNKSDANNSHEALSPSIKPLAPSLPGAKPHVSKSNKPVLSQNSGTAVQSEPNESQPQPGVVGIKTVVNPGGRSKIGSSSINNNSNSSSPSQQPQSQQSTPIHHASPSQSNNTSSSVVSTNILSNSVTVSSIGGDTSNNNNKATSIASSTTSAAASAVATNNNDEVAKLKKEMTEMRKEWSQEKAQLSSQISELKELIESQKKSLPSVVKELINELAEEKKKIANILIELDRLRKLNTTV